MLSLVSLTIKSSFQSLLKVNKLIYIAIWCVDPIKPCSLSQSNE